MAAPHETRVCPHCGKSFEADILGPNTSRAGFKCPHCKLFVPIDRADDPKHADAA